MSRYSHRNGFANLHPEQWTKTNVHDGFNKSRKLQKDETLKLHINAEVEINDHGNDLDDIKVFSKYLNIEINIFDSEQLNKLIFTANKGANDKIYLLKTRNHFGVIKSMTAFLDAPYYCHECKKVYTRKNKHKCTSKCLSCFSYKKGDGCKGDEILCIKCNRKFYGKTCFKITLLIDQKILKRIQCVIE